MAKSGGDDRLFITIWPSLVALLLVVVLSIAPWSGTWAAPGQSVVNQTVPGAASKLAFTVQPGSATAGSAFGTQPVVTVQDNVGLTVTSSTAAVTLAITPGSVVNPGTLSGTVTVNAVSGMATFSGLKIDTAGNGYTLTATSSGLTSASSSAFNVAAAAPITSRALSAGWNLVSLPLIPTSSAIATVLAGVSGSVMSVWSYDAVVAQTNPAAAWSSYVPGFGGSLTTMTDGRGYWMNMSAPATLVVSGSELPTPPATPPTYSVPVGWNLAGFKSTTSKTVGAYLTGTSYRFPIYTYGSGAYVTLTAISDPLQPGFGYWVYFNSAGIVTP